MFKCILVSIVLVSCLAIKPPMPSCRVNPFPSMLPVTIGQTNRFDLEVLFSGYNLNITGQMKDHISVSPKYDIRRKSLNKSMNFVAAKIMSNSRFLGLLSTNFTTTVVVGMNHDDSGVDIIREVEIQNKEEMTCYDIEEVFDELSSKVYAMADCAVFSRGKLIYNEFLYLDLQNYKLFLGSHISDAFVSYKQVTKRKIEMVVDPIHRVQYLWRFTLRDGVDVEHQGQTYAEVFLMSNPIKPQLLDVIDYTFLRVQNLSISDVQIHLGLIYILNYDNGVYQIRFTTQFQLQIRTFIPMSQGITKFRVDQLGFNDDLNIVGTNGHNVYQYDVDVTSIPVIVAKYTLLPNSNVQKIYVDYNFVVLLANNQIDGIRHRKIWVFTRRTPNYIDAYSTFEVPLSGPVIPYWQEHGSIFHLFMQYQTLNVVLSLPYIKFTPVDQSMAGKTQEYLLIANSTAGSLYTTCSQKIVVIYQDSKNMSVIKTGLMFRNQTYVDSPDSRDINLQYQFFGPNLTYDVKYQINSSITPRHYINKQHQATFDWPKEIVPQNITYFQMFTEKTFEERIPNSVYGLVQTQSAEKRYNLSYVKCQINVLDYDQVHHLKCAILNAVILPGELGRVVRLTQMFDPTERRIGVIFDQNLHEVMIFTLGMNSLVYYGRIVYDGIHDDSLTSVGIHNNQVYCVLQYGKRVDVYDIRDVEDTRQSFVNPKPILVLNSQIMRFFNVEYFAPIDITISRHHKEIIFIKTKVGILAMNINEFGMPTLLFNLQMGTSKYDFEVAVDTMVVITETTTTMYRLQVPLRREAPPYILQKLTDKYTLKEYDEVSCDTFFYVVREKGVSVLHPNLPSTSIYYTELEFGEEILNIDSVSIQDKELLFIHTKKEIKAIVLAKNPKLHISWYSQQIDFNISLTAINGKQQASQPYRLQFDVLPSSETQITPTSKFDAEAIKQLGHVTTQQNNQQPHSVNITIPDKDWFNGTILRYKINCTSCGKNITINNHITETRQILSARAIYDMHATYDGIFAQQYRSLIKTFSHNDSIQSVAQIPTQSFGQVCTKVAASNSLHYAVSLCQNGEEVNIYMTTYIGFKPFTLGPYRSEAKAVNYAKVVDDVLMIVDNDDDPFRRAGGVYLYVLDTDPRRAAFLFLDYLDYDDLQIEGFTGMPFIGSADIHKPSFGKQHFRLFLTESRTGAIFIFSFQLSQNRKQVVYTSKKYVPLDKLIPISIKYPTPIKVITVTIIDHILLNNRTEYSLLLTVANWHHMEIRITLDDSDNILFFQLIRLFQRYPWQLQNYVKLRTSAFEETNKFFAVTYINFQLGRQIVGVYHLPPHNLTDEIKIVPMIGAHWVRDVYQVSYAFNPFLEKLLFVDVDAYNITELDISLDNVTLKIVNMSLQEDVQVTAENGYHNFTFSVEVRFHYEKQMRLEVMWAIIMFIGIVMIIGIITVWVRQQHKKTTPQNKESLITVDDEYKNAYINRSSVDPESQRNTMDLRQQPVRQMVREQTQNQIIQDGKKQE